MSLKTKLDKYISVSDEILGGMPVFKNTRVPVKTLYDYLQQGKSLEEFVEDYPSVNPDFAVQVIELSAEYLAELDVNNRDIT